MLVIKLSQKGKTNKRMFRLIISEKNRDPYGNILETLGSYDPHSKDLSAKTERINYWLSKGAQMTATVNNLLVEKKIIEKKKVVASKKGKKSDKKVAQATAKDEKKKKAEEVITPEKAELKEDVAPEVAEVQVEAEVKTEEKVEEKTEAEIDK